MEGISDEILARVVAAAQQQNELLLVDTGGQIVIAVPMTLQSLKAGTLLVGLSLEVVQRQLAGAAVQSGLAALLWVVLGVAGAVLVARFLTRSIQNLTRGRRHDQAGQL